MKELVITPWQYRADTMRIGFSGSAGIGKTTLMNAANEFLGFPVISEGVRTWMKENKIDDVHKLEGRGLMKFQMDMLKRKRAAETPKQFVTDRTTLDAGAYCMYYLSDKEEFQRGVMDYCMECTMHAVQTYDVIFTLPYGAIPFVDDGVRKNLPAHQMMIQMLIEHSVALGSDIFNVHQIQSQSIEDRAAEVLEVVDAMTDAKARASAELEGKKATESELVH